MRGKIKSTEFIKFDFWTSTDAPTNMECSYSFKAQHSVGTSDKVLAIMVFFRADSLEDVVHFRAQCRVVFDFADMDELPNGDDLIDGNYIAAYQEFCKKANEALVILGHNPFDFHAI